MQQIILDLDSNESAGSPSTLEPQREQALRVVMAEAIITVQHSHQGEKAHDPDDCKR